MAEFKVESFNIGASAKFQMILESPFASYTDIVANVVSMQADEHVISKNKKVAATGYKQLIVDPLNEKAFWVFVEDSESAKAYKGVYLCDLTLIIPDSSYPSGQRTEKYKVPVLNFE